MHPLSSLFVYFQKRGKTILASLLIVVFTVLISSNNTQALYSYIETKISVKNNAVFALNGVSGHFDSVDINDIAASLESPVQFIFNKASSLVLLPHSQVQFLKLGETPALILLEGSVEVQTSTEADIHSNDNIILIKQGGAKITQTAEYSQIGNYYGSVETSIFNQKHTHILSYKVPLQKQITVMQKVYKDNWNKIRYTKLNKELLLHDFTEAVVREAFLPYDFSPFFKNTQTHSWTGALTLNKNREKAEDEKEFFGIVQNIMLAIKNKSKTQITTEVPLLRDYLDSPHIALLSKLENTSQDPLTRYTLETELMRLFHKNDESINTELKYFYTLWQQKDEKGEAQINAAVLEKVKAHKHNLYALEEDYNLITALIEAYPQMVKPSVLAEKKEVESNIFQLVTSDTEKIDIILSAFNKDLEIISQLIENDNGQLAKAVYNNMLIDNTTFSSPIITAYRVQLEDYEKEIAVLMDFYKEELHSSAYNNDVFHSYKKQKEQEMKAIELFKNNVQKVRTRPIKQDFSSVIQALQSQKITVQEENISSLFLGSPLLYIQNATLNLEQDSISFNFVYQPEQKVISQVIWSQDSRPPLEDTIPLAHFQDAILALQKIELEKHDLATPTRERAIQDWATMKEDTTGNNYEFAIKKRLAKEHLTAQGIASQENEMKIFQNTIHINEAIIPFTDETNKELKIPVNLRLQIDTWAVLGVQLAEFPERKLRSGSLGGIQNIVAVAYVDEMEKKSLTDEAAKDLAVFVENVKSEQFVVTDKARRMVSFQSLPFFFKSADGGEALWTLSGEMNTQTRIFTSLHGTNKAQTSSFTNIPLSSIQDTFLGDALPSSTPKQPTPQVSNQADAQKVIQDTLKESDMKDVKSILEDKNSFF